MNKNYNAISENTNKSFQPTETASFEFTDFNFHNVSAAET